jgi:hypothetical protein
MNTNSILVLANFADAAEATARYAAALGAPLHLRLVMLHLEVYPVMLEPELVAASAEQTQRNEAETMAGLQALARRLPGHTEVLEAAGIMSEAVADAVRQQHPLLLALGLSHEQSLLDHLLVEQVLPVLRATPPRAGGRRWRAVHPERRESGPGPTAGRLGGHVYRGARQSPPRAAGFAGQIGAGRPAGE